METLIKNSLVFLDCDIKKKYKYRGVSFCLLLMSIDCSFIGNCEGVITQIFLKWMRNNCKFEALLAMPRFISIPSTWFEWWAINNVPAVTIILVRQLETLYLEW